MISRRPLALTAFVLILGACNAFSNCGRHAPTATVARLDALAGAGQRAGTNNVWLTAHVGDEFVIGDAVRTGPVSTARVRLTAGGSLNLAPQTVLRFARNPASTPERTTTSVRVESGEAEVETGADPIELETSLGHAHIDRGSHVRVSATGGEHFEVVLGHVTLDQPDGHPLEAHTGERMIVAISGAILEPIGSIGSDAGIAAPVAANGTAEPAIHDAGTPLNAHVDVDASAPEAATTPVNIVIHGHGVRRRDASGAWADVPSGRSILPSGTLVSVPAHASLHVLRGNQHERVAGPADVILGAASEPLVRAAGAPETAMSAHAETPSVAEPTEPEPSPTQTASAAPEHSPAPTASAAPEPSPAPVANEPTVAPAMSITVGESATIHDEHAPTPIEIRFGSICPEGGAVEFSGHGAPATRQGSASVVAVLAAGHYAYALRCTEHGRIRSSGRLHILADSGRGEMPSTAPRSFIDTDGRRYSVLYQNLLPEITARWPAAPSRGGMTLNVRDGAGRTRTFHGSGESVVVPSGALAEGSYRIWMSNGAAQRSIDTVLVINFDNAARTAQLSEPHDPLDFSHGSMRVAGSALASSVVTVGSRRLPLDAQNRFRDTVPVESGQHALVVRIAHPSHGVQYYLRRVGTASQ